MDEQGDEVTAEQAAKVAARLEAAGGGTTISELLSMGADEAWQLVTSLLADPPTAVHATFDESQSRGKRPLKKPTPSASGGRRAAVGERNEL